MPRHSITPSISMRIQSRFHLMWFTFHGHSLTLFPTSPSSSNIFAGIHYSLCPHQQDPSSGFEATISHTPPISHFIQIQEIIRCTQTHSSQHLRESQSYSMLPTLTLCALSSWITEANLTNSSLLN
jgi:hypothetical protein